MPQRIYLDNAATSWPKPQAVYDAVDHYQREIGAPVGRSAYAEAADVEQQVAAARRGIAKLIGDDEAQRVVFTFNGTDSLNLALHGLLKAGDHVVTSVVEHNSVLRPLRKLQEDAGIDVTRVDCDSQGVVDPAAIRAALRPQTRLIALTHASNVTGALQPADEVGALARRHGCLFLLDAAQTLGYLPVDVKTLGVDLLAAPGHKGLLGPLGTGVLYVAPGVEEQLRSLRQGGTGSRSDEDRQPSSLPDKYESGNHNAPGLVGLGAAVRFLEDHGVEDARRSGVELTTRLLTGLEDIDGVTVYGPRDAQQQVGVVSLNIAGFDSQEIGATLDTAYRIQARAGIHCAPEMHRSLGTLATGGTVRLSIGHFNTTEEIDAAVEAIRQIASARLTI